MATRHRIERLKRRASRPLILASQSAARKKWLAKIVRARFPEIQIEIQPAHLDERAVVREEMARAKTRDVRMAKKIAARLAREKALAVQAGDLAKEVLGSDQLLWLDGEILGKPGTAANARRMLAKCAGQTGYLVTSVALAGERVRVLTQVNTLRFAKLDRASIARIVELDQPLACAGSFMFEEHGATLFDSVKTDDPTGIEGLSIMRVIRLLSFS